MKGKVEIDKLKWSYNTELHQFFKTQVFQPAEAFVRSQNINSKLSFQVNYVINSVGRSGGNIVPKSSPGKPANTDVPSYTRVLNQLNSSLAQAFTRIPPLPSGISSYSNSVAFGFNDEKPTESTSRCPGM